ncbi:MAG: dynamin family protein [Gammaproteobacteria bacterium]|nr:dynamin family protein [Gammaproteobacteria bacterium]
MAIDNTQDTFITEFFYPRRGIEKRLKNLKKHLDEENPVLLDAVDSFSQLDAIAFKIGLISRDESFATQIPWWPLVSILGTFSAGKSTFINSYLEKDLQTSGNQAVDDKFTVICYTHDDDSKVIPGLALDADPRFPFYNIAEDIEKVAPGEGQRINSYLQLKTCPTQPIKGKILIDSPGFDADSQRNSTLRITDHIIDLSDLVLVFFDARHPEPGAMKDTLEHLVTKTISRPDSSKFLYILNQIDTASKEDNPEEVVGAWQRALSQAGLTAGKFYMIYDEASASPIENKSLQERFKSKKDSDLSAIYNRMKEVEIERAYRIIGALEKTANDIEHKAVPALKTAIKRWSSRVITTDIIVFGLIIMASVYGLYRYDNLALLNPEELISRYEASPLSGLSVGLMIIVGLMFTHAFIRQFWAKRVAKTLPRSDMPGSLLTAFEKNTRYWRSVFYIDPVGWGRRQSRKIRTVIENSGQFVQKLNDSFTDPSGSKVKVSLFDNEEKTS